MRKPRSNSNWNQLASPQPELVEWDSIGPKTGTRSRNYTIGPSLYFTPGGVYAIVRDK